MVKCFFTFQNFVVEYSFAFQILLRNCFYYHAAILIYPTPKHKNMNYLQFEDGQGFNRRFVSRYSASNFLPDAKYFMSFNSSLLGTSLYLVDNENPLVEHRCRWPCWQPPEYRDWCSTPWGGGWGKFGGVAV